ncbi:MAG: cyclic nucleotide-binding domain-containing protein [Alphaproteobacteria bacterium]|nr:cyclic nucleotide-binding domain-containing protein [Alphaproteobacteria bacterium]
MSAAPGEAIKLEFKIAQNEADRKRIYEFRYKVLVEELGLSPPGADATAKTVRDAMDDRAYHFFVTGRQGAVAGAVRINLLKLGPLPERLAKAYQVETFKAVVKDAISFTDPVIVSRDYRTTNAPALLLGAAYKTVRGQGSKFDFCHCQPAHVALYEALGYRRFGDNFVNEVDEYQVPLVMVLEDVQHLSTMGSPLARLAQGFPNGRETSAWFLQKFPQSAAQQSGGMDEEKFWKLLTDKMHQTPLVGIPLLAGLEYRDAKKFLKYGTMLRGKRGDVIVRAGAIGKEMYIILTGDVEVRSPLKDGQKLLAKFGKGGLFGEMAFLSARPRTADVIAASDVELLVMSQDFLTKAMKALPEISSRVLFNLALVLVQRVEDANKRASGVAPAAAPGQPKPMAPGAASAPPPAVAVADPFAN